MSCPPALKSDSPGSTSLAVMFTDATTGASGLKWASAKRSLARGRARRRDANAPCAGAWAPMCPCGWAANPPCTWMPAPPPTALCRAATCAQRGQPGFGRRRRSRTGHTHSGPSAPSAPLPSARPVGPGSFSRDPSTSQHAHYGHQSTRRPQQLKTLLTHRPVDT